MKILSWNINGLRSVIRKGNIEQLRNLNDKEKFDVICFQETKISQIPSKEGHYSFDFEDMFIYSNPSIVRKGYSGTMTITREEPISYQFLNNEGRIIETKMNYFDNIIYDINNSNNYNQNVNNKTITIVNTYFPQSSKRLNYKLEFCNMMISRYGNYKDPIIICGDINIAPSPLDIWRPNDDLAGYTPQEREAFQQFLNHGFIDAFRYLHKDIIKYSWYDYRTNAKKSGKGWRIDHFLVKNIEPKESNILDFDGSDHMPITLTI